MNHHHHIIIIIIIKNNDAVGFITAQDRTGNSTEKEAGPPMFFTVVHIIAPNSGSMFRTGFEGQESRESLAQGGLMRLLPSCRVGIVAL